MKIRVMCFLQIFNYASVDSCSEESGCSSSESVGEDEEAITA